MSMLIFGHINYISKVKTRTRNNLSRIHDLTHISRALK